jgi:DNA helicase-2/ATP-dependent DNA helicase PcrA
MGESREKKQRSERPSLNAAQQRAIAHGEGPMLVVAGAGTGKTLVITERIRRLLESDLELRGEQILALTFTDKAAGEMKHRVVRAVGDRAEGVVLSTFHSFCLDLLRQINPGLGVIENLDYWILLRRNLAQLGLERYRHLAEPGKFLSDFREFFSRCQDELCSPDDFECWAQAQSSAFEREKAALDDEARAEKESFVAEQLELARVFRASNHLLRERNVAPFYMHVADAVAELRRNPDLLNHYRRRFRYILVDEFQDTNYGQIELLALLAGSRRNVFAVGDDDQAIYRFRGASFASFHLFVEKFIGDPAREEAHTITLDQNYRSTQRILRVAAQTITQNKDRFRPRKFLKTENPEGQKVRIAEFFDARAEARWVAAEIDRMHTGSRRWRDFAVLYRKHSHRNLLVTELERRGIPIAIKKLSILESPLVRDVLAYLRLLNDDQDDVSCARVLAAPAWGLDAAELVRLAERARRGHRRSLWDVFLERQAEQPAPPWRGRAAELIDWIARARRRKSAAPASELLEELLAWLGLVLTEKDPEKRRLERLVSFVTDWEQKSETKRLAELIEYLDFAREAGEDITLDDSGGADAVQLMTVHGAKGLEFPIVFVLRVTRANFPPIRRSRLMEFPPELMKERLPQGDFHVQEERRLFYVAETRARQQLVLTTISQGRVQPSAFITELLEPGAHRGDVVKIAPEIPAPVEKRRKRLLDPRVAGSRAHSQIGSWAERYRPPVPRPLQLSATAVEGYDGCPQKYLFGSVWRLAGVPGAAAEFGRVMHLVVKQIVSALHNRHRMTLEDALGVFDREWTGSRFHDEYQREEYRKAGREQVQRFFEGYSAAPGDVLAQEREFELAMENDVVIEGRIDQINRLGKEAVEIVDYKTGRPKDEKDAKKSLQLSLYAIAARDVFEWRAERLTLYNLATNEAVSAARDDKSLDAAAEEVQSVAENIRAGHFPAKPEFLCRWCDFVSICPAKERALETPDE